MISRAHMRRQLRANGGITNLRQGYGLGDFVRKLIPNELASIASKAAPFVAPFNPLAAGIMRGVGRYDKRGSLKDALKQGIGTFAGGKVFGKGMEKFAGRPSGGSALETLSNLKDTAIEKTGNLFSGDKKLFNKIGVPKVGELAKQQLLFGATTGGLTYIYEKFIKEEPPQQPGETMGEYMARRKKNVSTKMRQYMDNYMAFDKDYTSKTEEEKQEYIDSLNTEYEGYNQGGRVGFSKGTMMASVDDPFYRQDSRNELALELFGKELRLLTPEEMDLLNEEAERLMQKFSGPVLPSDEDPINPFGPKPIGPVLPDNSMMASSKTYMDYVRAAVELGIKPIRIDEFESLTPIMDVNEILKLTDDLNERNKKADGGIMRTGLAIGSPNKQLEAGAPPIMYSGNMDPNQKTGLPSIPGPIQMAEDGPEFDMRENGGFQPLGRQEGKDDVPAMLAKNEFVMTADAVRAAGGGSIQKGAQKMYDTMKKLESRVS